MIFRIAETGGTPEPIDEDGTERERAPAPSIFPDGRRFFYQANGAVYVGSIDGSTPRRLFDADRRSTAEYANGYLFFWRPGTLMAQRFDPDTLALTGSAVHVVEGLAAPDELLSPGWSVSRGGSIAYRAATPINIRQLIWFDRSGAIVSEAGETLVSSYAPELSPDGRRVLIGRTINQVSDLWVLDLSRRNPSRLTTTGRLNGAVFPVWSPTGDRVAFASSRDGRGAEDLYQRRFDGAGGDDLLLHSSVNKIPVSWSPDGRFLLFRAVDAKTGYDLWALPMTGERQPFPVVRTDLEDRDGQFSPDGHWVAFQSNVTGRFEIYVQPFPGPGPRVLVSAAGGAQVRWRRDGRELFYIALDGRLTAVPIMLGADGKTVEVGTGVPLFAVHTSAVVDNLRQHYAVSQDGQRFLINVVKEEAAPPPIEIVMNWTDSSGK